MDLSPLFHCRAILFDFGGTLDSDGEHWLDRFYGIYEAMGLTHSRSEIKRAFYHADETCYGDSRVLKLGLRPLMAFHVALQMEHMGIGDKGARRRAADLFCRDCERFLQRNAALLKEMSRRYTLGLVSNFYGNLPVICEEAGLADIMALILDSALIGMSKPDPGIFLRALRELGLSPSEVLFVGDSYERDMIPAHDLGMRTLWLKGAHPPLGGDDGPLDGRISSLTQLAGLLT